MTTINTESDFLRALTEHPEWKAAVRAQILGEELLLLPVRFNAFVEEQKEFNTEFREAITEFNGESVADLKSFNVEQRQANAEFRRVDRRVEGVQPTHTRRRGDSQGRPRRTRCLGPPPGHP